ncbi:hypothetical protein N865_14160 [Intrasporangium oryzae NRRL B-24470]|uniref:VOC domain-containing protein n=1 Tax=Intrasporangium oryzae NRRL B-24470 TaxID=1386089 RepID=W9G3G7_9MICO|nr:VOC family protein [Intrasporangium oryzae]EWT00666.1 hypothetical protein N865_14160 [Intrasporangium oryzae NRRL B-24470]
MTSILVALCIDGKDPHGLARFWGGVLDWPVADDGRGIWPSGGTGFGIRFNATTEPKTGPNRMHLHLTSTSLDDQRSTVERALELGGRHLDVGQLPEEEHVVLADPEGNELCVIEPGNRFLAGCGFLGEVACDGTRAVGHFWSEALGWPLVWDEGEETAIQSPAGGTKIAWGGPPLPPKTGKNRLHFDLAPSVADDLRAEVDRLLSLGATRVASGPGTEGAVALADPDGNEFCVLPAR